MSDSTAQQDNRSELTRQIDQLTTEALMPLIKANDGSLNITSELIGRIRDSVRNIITKVIITKILYQLHLEE